MARVRRKVSRRAAEGGGADAVTLGGGGSATRRAARHPATRGERLPRLVLRLRRSTRPPTCGAPSRRSAATMRWSCCATSASSPTANITWRRSSGGCTSATFPPTRWSASVSWRASWTATRGASRCRKNSPPRSPAASPRCSSPAGSAWLSMPRISARPSTRRQQHPHLRMVEMGSDDAGRLFEMEYARLERKSAGPLRRYDDSRRFRGMAGARRRRSVPGPMLESWSQPGLRRHRYRARSMAGLCRRQSRPRVIARRANVHRAHYQVAGAALRQSSRGTRICNRQ